MNYKLRQHMSFCGVLIREEFVITTGGGISTVFSCFFSSNSLFNTLKDKRQILPEGKQG